MGFDGNGKWTSNFYPMSDRDNGVAILASKFQNLIQNDIKSGFDNCILRDGTGRPTTNINWNGYKITNLAAGTGATDAVKKEQLDTSISGSVANRDLSNLTQTGKDMLVPVGCLQMAPLASLTGYLLCDGSAVSRAAYANLFSVIGVNFGVGDGVTTFNVPDYRGCFLRGYLAGTTNDMYTKQPMGAPNIVGWDVQNWYGVHAGIKNSGQDRSGAFSAQLQQRSGGEGGDVRGSSQTATPRGVSFNAASSNSVYGAANEIRPVNFAVNYFIKY